MKLFLSIAGFLMLCGATDAQTCDTPISSKPYYLRFFYKEVPSVACDLSFACIRDSVYQYYVNDMRMTINSVNATQTCANIAKADPGWKYVVPQCDPRRKDLKGAAATVDSSWNDGPRVCKDLDFYTYDASILDQTITPPNSTQNVDALPALPDTANAVAAPHFSQNTRRMLRSAFSEEERELEGVGRKLENCAVGCGLDIKLGRTLCDCTTIPTVTWPVLNPNTCERGSSVVAQFLEDAISLPIDGTCSQYLQGMTYAVVDLDISL